MMYKTIFSIVSALLIAFHAQSQTKNFIDLPYLEVSGTADTFVTPNEIYIKIIINEKDSRNNTSVEEQEAKMIAAFKTLGINTEENLTTSDMLSNYRFYFLKTRAIVKSKEYILKVTSAELASKVFIQLEDLDISNTSIHRLNHTELEQVKNICRGKAVANAKTNAIALTEPIGQSIGNAIHIVDSDVQFRSQLEGRASGIEVYKSSAKYEPPKIEFEKIKVSASVAVKFLLR